MAGPELRPMRAGDFAQLMALWQAADGVQLRDSDTPQALARFLARNPGCSWVAEAGEDLVGAVMAGHDGWRGALYHLAVRKDFRGRGLGGTLVRMALEALRAEGVPKVHCLVKRDNAEVGTFWEGCGFALRDDVLLFGRESDAGPGIYGNITGTP